MKCDIIAHGILEAVKETKIGVPITVRLSGTNSAEGRKLLDQSGLNFISAENLDEAAQRAVEALKLKK
jgi:succinyl-CoA synthetase beta subunit